MGRGDDITMEGDRMLVKTSYGPVWVSEDAPYYRDYLGKQLYKHRIAGRRATTAAQTTG